MVNPIRIHTHLSEQASVITLYFNGKWVTMAHLNGKSEGSTDATNLEEGGRNHLHMAYQLREKVAPAKNWQERADRDGGFIDDDMGDRG